MKKLVLITTIAMCITAFVSCKKEKIVYIPTPIDKVDGINMMSFDNVEPIEDFTKVPMISSWSPYTGWYDSTFSANFRNFKLKPDTAKTVYLVSVPGYMSFAQAQELLSLRGWKLASDALVGGLIKKYSPYLMGLSFICLKVSKDVNLGQGIEPVALWIQCGTPYTGVWIVSKTNNMNSSFYAVYK